MNEHFDLTEDDDAWIWLDYLSVPQSHRQNQVLAIASLCAYASLTSRFIPLVRNSKEWERLYGEKIRSPGLSSASMSFHETSFHADDEDEDEDEDSWSRQEKLPGTLPRYLKRAWCRLELLAALCPKRSEAIGQNVSWICASFALK